MGELSEWYQENKMNLEFLTISTELYFIYFEFLEVLFLSLSLVSRAL